MTCIVEFDGASKGNPGQAGAGAILRNVDGSVVDISHHISSIYFLVLYFLTSKMIQL